MNKNKTIGFFLILSMAVLAYFVVGLAGNIEPEMVNVTTPATNDNISGTINLTAEIIYVNETTGQFVNLVAINWTNQSTQTAVLTTYIHNQSSPNQTLFWNDSSFDTTALVSGIYDLNVTVYNHSVDNNITMVQGVVVNVTIDNTAPFIGAIVPAVNFTNVSGVYNFNVTADDHTTSLIWVYFQVIGTGVSNNYTAVNNSGVWNYTLGTTAIADGNYTLTIFANDTVGNVNGSQSMAFTVDNTVPTVSITLAMEINFSNASVNIPSHIDSISSPT